MSQRGMKKYLPFSSLTEQATYLEKMMYEKNKQPRPRISTEQAEKINRILLQDIDKELHIKFYLDGYFYYYDGKIDFLDTKNKIIVIGEYNIPFKDIIDIESPNVFDEIC